MDQPCWWSSPAQQLNGLLSQGVVKIGLLPDLVVAEVGAAARVVVVEGEPAVVDEADAVAVLTMVMSFVDRGVFGEALISGSLVLHSSVGVPEKVKRTPAFFTGPTLITLMGNSKTSLKESVTARSCS